MKTNLKLVLNPEHLPDWVVFSKFEKDGRVQNMKGSRASSWLGKTRPGVRLPCARWNGLDDK